MPIPGLPIKTQSPQHWKKRFAKRKYQVSTSFGRQPVYLGRFKKRPPKLFIKKIFKLIFILLILVLIIFSITSIFLISWFSRDLPNPNKIIQRSMALSTKIYDRKAEVVLYDIHGTEKRTMVELEDIPDYVKWATLVAEDRKFYQHKGISFRGIIRATLVDIIKKGKVQGASTLTQQLIKNVILTPEKTYTRKIKEIVLSIQIEKKFSKDEILKMYFNEIPYGSTAYGIAAASQTYFGKDVKNLTLAEAATLAALPKAPTYYSPHGTHLDELIGRQHYILEGMVEEGYLTKEQAATSKKEKLNFKQTTNIIAPHFVMYVKEYLTEKYGQRTVEEGGLKVITTLDLEKQKIAEEAIENQIKANLSWDATNAALVASNSKTGQILAMVGSKDFFDKEIDGQVNVTIRPRQPGSSFKPIVYAAAFKRGFTPETILYDVETVFKNYDGKDYEPKNYNLKEYGPVTIKKALAGSLNIPAVKTIYLAGIDKVLDTAEDFGYTTLKDRSRFGLSLVLGGGEIKLLEHVSAFATFAQEGEWHQISPILKVEDKDGNILEEFKKKEKKVIATQVARQINSILSDNSARTFIFGEQNFLNLGERPVAAKTGTTDNYRDAWTIGYTPSLTAGVWVGNSRGESMKRGADGSVVAAPIWHQFMNEALKNSPVEYFIEPQPVKTGKSVIDGTIIEGVKVKIDKASGKLATNLTPESYIEEKTYQQVHSILYYIDKNDPLGPPPADPEADPQYQRWEEAVQKWAEKQNIISEEPPTEYDDLHTLANKPKLKIISPQDNTALTDRNLEAEIQTSAPRGVNRVEYYLNNKLIKTVTTPPFNLNISLEDPTIESGFYELKVISFDDIDNSWTEKINLNLMLPSLPISFSWTSSLRIKIF